jgi:hypothetical protein
MAVSSKMAMPAQEAGHLLAIRRKKAPLAEVRSGRGGDKRADALTSGNGHRNAFHGDGAVVGHNEIVIHDLKHKGNDRQILRLTEDLRPVLSRGYPLYVG